MAAVFAGLRRAKAVSTWLRRAKWEGLKPSGYGAGGGFLLAYWGVSGMDKVRKDIGANIRALRQKARLSQEGLAEKAELHPVYISQLECGLKSVSMEGLWKLSRALGVEMIFMAMGCREKTLSCPCVQATLRVRGSGFRSSLPGFPHTPILPSAAASGWIVGK